MVLIHCAAGISRTPSFLIAWLMEAEREVPVGDWRPDYDAVRNAWSRHEDNIRTIRPIIQPHWRLKTSILAIFKKLEFFPKAGE